MWNCPIKKVQEDVPFVSPHDSGNAMRKTYILDITEREFVDGVQARYNASGKPRNDTVTTLCKMGARLVELRSLPFTNMKNRWKKRILKPINKVNLILQWSRWKICDSVVFVQYPFISCPKCFAKYILQKLKACDNKLIFIIHDIESIRHKDKKNVDKSLLTFTDIAIVHSPQMGEALRNIAEKNIATIPLEYFDYLSDINVNPQTHLRSIKLVFAGNLSKAPFITNLPNIPLGEDFQINLYGVCSPLVKENQYVHYRGKFDAEEFSTIEGNWGLVWDGEDTQTCSGEFGEYLRINAPFKFSLYLAANRPVVVWSQSAMAQYVTRQYLGICVDSLSDIPNVISALSDKELEEISRCVANASEKVKYGLKLRQAVKRAIDACNSLNINGGG